MRYSLVVICLVLVGIFGTANDWYKKNPPQTFKIDIEATWTPIHKTVDANTGAVCYVAEGKNNVAISCLPKIPITSVGFISPSPYNDLTIKTSQQ